MFSLFSLVFLIGSSSSVLYDGKFFEPKNKIMAECIARKSMSSYQYLGNADKSIDGEACVPWEEVTESWFATANNSVRQLKDPSESFRHSKCRSLQLRIAHPMYDVTSKKKNSVVNPTITSGERGPWCFISEEGTDGTNDFQYSPVICFPTCDESKIVSTSEKKRVTENGFTHLKLNYNPTLLDPIDKLFADYQFGDMNYYTHKKSQEQPPEFFELRQRVFLVLCAIFFAVIIWILACFFLKRHSQKVHRKKQKALKEFFESTNLADIKMQAELRRETDDA